MKKALIILAAVSMLIVVSCATSPEAEKAKPSFTLAVLHTNDFHGHPVKFYNYPAPDVGGLPAISNLVTTMRAEYDHVLVLDAGDLNTGRPESNFFNAEPDLVGYNHIGYDAMALGNHEFDKSLDYLKKQMELANFPMISANVRTNDGKLLTDPYIIKDYDGFKIGIFGLTTTSTDILSNPESVQHLTFDDEIETAKKMVEELSDKTDMIIALTHLGLYEKNEQGSRRVAANVEGIDLIIDGHSHSQIEEPVVVNGTPIVQAWHWGLNVGRGSFEIEEGEIASFAWEALPVNLKNRINLDDGSSKYEPIGQVWEEDQKLLALLTPYVEKVDEVLSEIIGTAGATFFNTDVRKQETALGDMVADSMLWYTKGIGADFAIQNGGGIRADLPEGDIAKRVIYEVLPFDNSVMVMTLEGKEVQAMFDFIATIPQGKGAFPQVSDGVEFTINYDKGICENVLINGSPINLNAEYKIATNSFLAAGGDGYSMFKNSVDSYDTSAFQRDVLIEYIQDLGGNISPNVQGRIQTIGQLTAFIKKLILELAA